MKRKILLGISILFMTVGFNAMADNSNDCNNSNVNLSGFEEVPPILTTGAGTLKLKLDPSRSFISYTLTFSGLSANATASHIHFGQAGVNGGVMAFLCGGGSKPACPPTGGTVNGVIMAADILGVPAQGVNALSFSDFLNVLRSGNGYVNVHTTTRPSGEIRGQIKKNIFICSA